MTHDSNRRLNCLNCWNRSNSEIGTIQMNCCWLSGMHGDFDANFASLGCPLDHRSTWSVARPSLRHGFLIWVAMDIFQFTNNKVLAWIFFAQLRTPPTVLCAHQFKIRIKFISMKIPDAFFWDTDIISLGRSSQSEWKRTATNLD